MYTYNVHSDKGQVVANNPGPKIVIKHRIKPHPKEIRDLVVKESYSQSRT